MSITSSEVIVMPQCEGHLSVLEWHTDHLGRRHPRVYFAPAGFDANAAMAAHAVTLQAVLKAGDLFMAVYKGLWNYVMNHATNAELVAFVRAEYLGSNGERTVRVARRMMEWITNGRFTELQVRNAFNLSVSQWNTLKAKMQALISDEDAVNAAAPGATRDRNTRSPVSTLCREKIPLS